MKSFSPIFSLPTSNPPASVSAFTFHSLPFSLHAQIQNPKTQKNPTLNKRSSNPTINISPTPVLTPTISPPSSVPPKKVLVPIGFGSEEMEAVIIIDILRRAGAAVTVASVEEQLVVEASAGTKLVAEAFISDCSSQTFDLVALPGGMPGSARLRDCKILQEITTKQAEQKRLYGAICAAPAVTLLPWGLLKRKQTTCHPAFMGKLSQFWAVKSNFQVSGELTTSRGPGTSFEFAVSLVEQLFGESVAKEVCDSTLLSSDDVREEEFNEVSWSLDNTPRVLIPLANGCEEVEVVTIIDILRRANAYVTVASVEKSLQILGSNGTKIIADNTISAASESIYDLIILAGGISGAERLHKSRILKKLLKEQVSAGRFFGALGSSPAILQKQGFLREKRVTAHPSVSTLSDSVNGTQVVIDGKVITSKGLSTATNFALCIVSKLFGKARARSVAEGLVFKYPG